MQKIVVIVGPTASGKSDLAVELAKEFDGEVISADSRQVYTGLDIGTGKITKDEMQGIPHHLLDVSDPKDIFTAHDFLKQGRDVVKDIQGRGKLPIVAGGTGFYIDALMGRVKLGNTEENTTLRRELETKSPEELFTLLEEKDPERAAMLDTESERNHKRRLIRALEVTLSPTLQYQGNPLISGDVLWLGIETERDALRERIRARLISRLDDGMIEEAKKRNEEGLSYERMEELGLEYRYLAWLFQGKITREDLIEQLSAKIWQYARRQTTYWKRNENIHWLPLSEKEAMVALVQNFLKKGN